MNQNRNPPKSTENRQRLTRRQAKALASLISSKSVAEAARRCGCAESTLHLYLRNETFKAEYERRLDALIDGAANRVKQGLGPALGVLQDIAEDDTQPPASRVTAARGLIEGGLRVLKEHEDHKLIEALGEQLKQIQDGR